MPKTSKYQPLYDLGEEGLIQVERFIRQGMPLKTLAQRMHKHNMLTDLPVRNLTTLLKSYERDVMDRGLMKSVEEAGILDAARKGAQLNLHEELMTGLAIQKGRVAAVAEQQAKNPSVLIEQHGKEVKNYTDMIERALRVQMDMGIIQRPPRRQTMQVLRDAETGSVVRLEVTDEVVEAVEEVEALFGGEIRALPAPA